MIVAPLSVIAHVLAPDAPPEDWANGDFHFSESPKPCVCGNHELHVVETQPRGVRGDPQRVAVHCSKCHAVGQDTVHGKANACRRWNWYGDQRNQATADIIPFSLGGVAS